MKPFKPDLTDLLENLIPGLGPRPEIDVWIHRTFESWLRTLAGEHFNIHTFFKAVQETEKSEVWAEIDRQIEKQGYARHPHYDYVIVGDEEMARLEGKVSKITSSGKLTKAALARELELGSRGVNDSRSKAMTEYLEVRGLEDWFDGKQQESKQGKKLPPTRARKNPSRVDKELRALR